MPRSIIRKTLAPFGYAGPLASFAQFGSQAQGTPVKSKDPAVIQSLAAWLAGWQNAVTGSNAPYLEDMNAVHFLLSYMEAYILQEGIAEWDASTTYYIGSIVKAPGTFQMYGSLTDGNLNQALPSLVDNTNWKYLGQTNSYGSSANIAGTPGTITQGTISTPDLRDGSVTLTKLAVSSVAGSTANSGGSPRGISPGTISTPDLRTNAVSQQSTGTASVSITTIGGYVLVSMQLDLSVLSATGALSFVGVDCTFYITRDGSTTIYSARQSINGVTSGKGQILSFCGSAIDTPSPGAHTYTSSYSIGTGSSPSVLTNSGSAVELRA